MVTESITWFLTGVAQLLTSLVAIATLLGLTDKFIGGKFRNLLQKWLGITRLQSASERHDRKLDLLHGEHLTSIGIQNDLSAAHNNLTRALVEEDLINDGGRSIFVDRRAIEEHAQDAGADWPGSFLRGGTTDLSQEYPSTEEEE